MKTGRAIIECVTAQDQCKVYEKVYEIDLKRLQRERSGNFWFDF